MCKGTEDEKHLGLCRRLLPPEDIIVTSHDVSRGSVCCELCEMKATLYCQADDAYLCRDCDEWVHNANFLAFRHVRCFLCNTCQNLTRRYLIPWRRAVVEVVVPTSSSSNRNGTKCSR